MSQHIHAYSSVDRMLDRMRSQLSSRSCGGCALLPRKLHYYGSERFKLVSTQALGLLPLSHFKQLMDQSIPRAANPEA